ncbi:hypothetical protein FQZ97_1030250 [compost metagenome]
MVVRVSPLAGLMIGSANPSPITSWPSISSSVCRGAVLVVPVILLALFLAVFCSSVIPVLLGARYDSACLLQRLEAGLEVDKFLILKAAFD